MTIVLGAIPASAASFLKQTHFCSPRQELPLVALPRAQKAGFFFKKLSAKIGAMGRKSKVKSQKSKVESPKSKVLSSTILRGSVSHFEFVETGEGAGFVEFVHVTQHRNFFSADGE